MNDTLFFAIGIPFMIIINGLWLWMKSILKENGYKVSSWNGHWGDVFVFNKLIREETDLDLKSKYKNIRFALLGSFFLFILVILYLIFLS